MLTADEIDDLTFGITELYQDFHDDIITDIARRVGSLDYAKATAALQVQRLNEAGMLYDDILAKVGALTGKSDKELRSMFKAAGVTTTNYDDEIYRAAGLNPLPLNLSPSMQEALVAGLKKTSGSIKNLTMTTASAGQEAYLKATDLAYMQISTGTQSYSSAIRQAVKEMSAKGITTVQFAKRVDQIDVAIRRAAITGVSQTSAQMQLARMDEMGVDLVAVSAHVGARPKHQLWQGKVYSRTGAYGKYEDLVAATGYGSGDGLMGWNCRHSMYPFFEGISEEHYKRKELDTYANETVPYNGKDVPFYEATQMQRGMERDIRKWKREANALAEAKVDNTPEVMRVQQSQAKLRDFIKQTGLMRQREREGFRTRIFKSATPAKPVPKPAPKPVAKSKIRTMHPDEIDAMRYAEAENGRRKFGDIITNSPLSRGEWKDQIITNMLQELKHMDNAWTYDDVNELIHQWAISSNDEQKLSLRAQSRAAKLFDTPISPWQEKKLQEAMALGWDPSDKITDEMLDSFLTVMHRQTQTYLRRQGIKEVVVYRGVKLRAPAWNQEVEDSVKDAMEAVWNSKGRKMKLDVNAMSSWSSENFIAHGFAGNSNGFVLEAVVPVENIIGTCLSGYGCLNEYELVVLGTADDWAKIIEMAIRGHIYGH